jgi:hypothetical protein
LAKKNRIATGVRNPRHDAHSPVEVHAQVRDVEDVHSNRAEAEAGGDAQRKDDSGASDERAGLHELSISSSAELIAVTPGSEFRTLWLPDSYQLKSFPDST